MRILVDRGYTVDHDLELSTFSDDIAAWFGRQPSLGPDTWLLAYAEDGVIWGKVKDGRLELPSTATPSLSPTTLLEARLFGADGEIHVWRVDEQNFQGCRIIDKQATSGAFDEWQRLWGTDGEREDKAGPAFTTLVDGREGLRHVVPLVVTDDHFTNRHPRFHPVILQTRHYFQVDAETGVTSIALSRLVSIKAETFGEYRERVTSNE